MSQHLSRAKSPKKTNFILLHEYLCIPFWQIFSSFYLFTSSSRFPLRHFMSECTFFNFFSFLHFLFVSVSIFFSLKYNSIQFQRFFIPKHKKRSKGIVMEIKFKYQSNQTGRQNVRIMSRIGLCHSSPLVS